jgi:2-hydroxychromene-2-carboxylate isomerase
MIDRPLITETELQARALLQNNSGDDMYVTIAKGVFRAMWSSAMTLSHVQAVGIAINSLSHLDQDALQAALTKLVRAKVLRTRSAQGRKFYEVRL